MLSICQLYTQYDTLQIVTQSYNVPLQKLLRKAVSQEEDFLKEQQEDEDKLAVHTRATKEDIQVTISTSHTNEITDSYNVNIV